MKKKNILLKSEYEKALDYHKKEKSPMYKEHKNLSLEAQKHFVDLTNLDKKIQKGGGANESSEELKQEYELARQKLYHARVKSQ